MSNDRRISLRRILSRPFIVAGVVLVVAGGSIGAWAVTRPTASATSSHRLFPAVRTTLSQTLSATGTIEPTTTDTLSFNASGQVTAVYATVGQRVTSGQNLATMESASLQAQVAQAKATLAEDQSRLSQDEASGASTAQIAADQATVNADQSQVDSAEAALSGATLTSPIDGIVATVGLTVGEQVSGGSGGGGGGADGGSGAGTDGGSGGGGDSGSGDSGSGGSGSGSSDTSITVISASDVVDANVGASVVDHIKAGDPVMITTEGANGPVAGTVASIGLTADTSSGVATFPVVIDVTGTPSGLYAGASASVTITYHQVADVLAVPAAAVLLGPGGKAAVHVMVNGHQVTKTVTTGLTVNGLTQITSGLTAGERVVVNLVKISPGSSGPGGGSGVFVGPGGHVIQINGGPGPGIGG